MPSPCPNCGHPSDVHKAQKGKRRVLILCVKCGTNSGRRRTFKKAWRAWERCPVMASNLYASLYH